MQRILIVGCSGSGKSTLAVALGHKLGLPVIHLDTHFWMPGWVQSPKADWPATVTALLQAERWVMDGNYAASLEERLAVCDTVVFLDRGRIACLWRIVNRLLTYRGRTRPDLPEGCPEQVDWEFYRWVWNYTRDVKPGVVETLRKHAGKVRIVTLRSDREIAEWLASQPVAAASDCGA